MAAYKITVTDMIPQAVEPTRRERMEGGRRGGEVLRRLPELVPQLST